MPANQPADLDRLLGEALNAGDLDAMVALYEPDGSFSPEPGKAVSGSEAIREALAGFLAMKPVVTMDVKTLAQAEDIALTTANWQLQGTGPDGAAIELSGQSLEVSRKQPDGTWLFVIDNAFGLG